MDKRIKLFCRGGFFVLAFLLLYATGAGAVQGQTYTGDGARNNSVVPPGGWLNSGYFLDSSCFACHNGNAAPPFNTAPNMTSYLNTGHKNSMRMVQNPPLQLTGAGGLAYTTDQYGNPFTWTTNTINILGFCTTPAFLTPSACTGGGGVWISGIKSLYYIFGGWMDEAPGALYDGRYMQGAQMTAVSFGSCARCHTTGFSMDTFFQGGRAPDAFFLGGISWTPDNSSGKISFDPDGDGPAILSSWPIVSSTGKAAGLEGVQCERCHDASNHLQSDGSATRPRGIGATALCLQCHRQDHILPYGGEGLGSNIVPTAYTDNGPMPANEPLYPLPAIEVGGPDGYEPGFYDYSIGIEFLNGVHAKFTGNFQQIADPTKYTSTFQETLYSCSKPLYVNQTTCTNNGGVWSSSVVQGGCTTCHEVHQSTVKAVNAAAPFKSQCSVCHSDKANNLASQVHPDGPGTPLGDGLDVNGACVKCHMPRPDQGSGPAMHLFRINVSSDYDTFPTSAQWNSGQKTANTSPDGTYTNAVWADLDLVCGQCHGGGADQGTNPPQAGVPYLTKLQAASIAPYIHSIWTDIPDSACATCHTSSPHTLSIPMGSTACQGCHTSHGLIPVAATCNVCHASGPLQPFTPTEVNALAPYMHGPYSAIPSATCVTCHGPHVLSIPMGSTACQGCHTVHGSVPVAGTTVCAACHPSFTQPQSDSLIGYMHGPWGGISSSACTSCHSDTHVLSFGSGNVNCQTCHTQHGAAGIPVWGTIPSSTCTTCHTSSHALSIPMGSTGCQDCHTDHGVIPVAATCNVCHSAPPIAPFTTTEVNALAPYMHGAYSAIPDATCETCHGTKTLKYTMPGVNCTQCHTSHGFLPITPVGTPNPTCRTCHPVGSYDAYAVNMHMDKPTANFGLSKNGLTVNVDASASTCPTGGTCTYSWDFGDSGTGSGQTTSHTYGSEGTYTVTLTVTDTTHNTSATASQSVTVSQPNRPPVAAFASGSPSMSGWTVTVTDASTDPDGYSAPNGLTGSSAITVTWGDGSSAQFARGGTVSHTYTVANTYTVSLKATDAAGLSSTNSCTYSAVVSMGTVTGTVRNGSGNPVNLAKVTITVPGATKTAYTNSSGVYTINNVQPGTGRAMTATSGATTFATQAWVTSGVVGTVNSGTNIVNFTP